MNISDTIIVTERLKLLPLSARFEYDVFRFFTSDITAYMIPQPTCNIADTQAFIQSAIKARQEGTDLEYAITQVETGEFLGCIGLHESHTSTPELGLWLKKEAHGHKYGKEAILGIMEFASFHLDIDHFVYKADRRNIASRRIPESCGGIMVSRADITNTLGKPLYAIEYHIPALPRPGNKP